MLSTTQLWHGIDNDPNLLRLVQVDVTAAEAVPGKIPAVNSAAEGQVKQATGMIGTALQHMGLGPDPWKSIAVGVMPAKPHTAVRVFRATRHFFSDPVLLGSAVAMACSDGMQNLH